MTTTVERGCRAGGCAAPIAGIARCIRRAEPHEPSCRGRVWGPWDQYCATHLDLLDSERFWIVRDTLPLPGNNVIEDCYVVRDTDAGGPTADQ